MLPNAIVPPSRRKPKGPKTLPGPSSESPPRQSAGGRRNHAFAVENGPWQGLGQRQAAPLRAAAAPLSRQTTQSRHSDRSVVMITSPLSPNTSRTGWRTPQPASPEPRRPVAAGIIERSLQAMFGLWQGAVATPPPLPPKPGPMCGSLDKEIRKRLARHDARAAAEGFDANWQALRRGGDDLRARSHLATLYAQQMQAYRVTAHAQEFFARCIRIGDRALELDAHNLAAAEQMAIAYSIKQVPLAEAIRYCDLTVALAGLTALAATPQHAGSAPAYAHVTADFYYAYWRTFRADAARQHQVATALQIYWEAPKSMRRFDAEILSRQSLANAMRPPA